MHCVHLQKLSLAHKQKTPATREVVRDNIRGRLGEASLKFARLREVSELAPGFSAIRKLLLFPDTN